MKVFSLNRHILSMVVLMAMSLPLFGCGSEIPELAYVAGKVTRNGKPVPNAQVIFTPTSPNAAAAAGGTDEEGNYTLRYLHGEEGSPLGECSVRISIEPFRPDIESPAVGIPETFNVPEKSNVYKGDNLINFKLEECGKPVRG
jgi:hypothetical protein